MSKQYRLRVAGANAYVANIPRPRLTLVKSAASVFTGPPLETARHFQGILETQLVVEDAPDAVLFVNQTEKN